MNDEILCRCEEITEGQIREAIRQGATTVNEIKRWTRSGMGLCQGRTCRRLMERILSEEMGIPLKEITPATFRQPVRPIRMGIFSEIEDRDE
ncbi:MAG: (2Fe-2S)-binding protein [Anaerosolibacter sp.]|uniref:(2Fe-2S)-binding protein n=1 Tax=Anaerosolibacter sp. TaxID=1872527 RepID=UPI002617A1EE|nr:(2Fe-2S)-binding protein [Anaerosolibacter sp.]MDF2548484.1 (2Fe-2S)-binding protein [Anaerosolibacter sp.]